MARSICPWWFGYFLASPLRRLSLDPAAILRPHVLEGMTVLEPGPGMGFLTLPLARLVGTQGRVVAVDIQPRILESLRRRARGAGLGDRIEPRLADVSGMDATDLRGRVDFVLAFAVVHELPDIGCFFREAAGALKSGGKLLFSEPAGHVSDTDFAKSLEAAADAGLRPRGNARHRLFSFGAAREGLTGSGSARARSTRRSRVPLTPFPGGGRLGRRGAPMRYRVLIERDEDGSCVAECPSLPGCVSQGKTRTEAIRNIRDAMKGYLASIRKHGEPPDTETPVAASQTSCRSDAQRDLEGNVPRHSPAGRSVGGRTTLRGSARFRLSVSLEPDSQGLEVSVR